MTPSPVSAVSPSSIGPLHKATSYTKTHCPPYSRKNTNWVPNNRLPWSRDFWTVSMDAKLYALAEQSLFKFKSKSLSVRKTYNWAYVQENILSLLKDENLDDEDYLKKAVILEGLTRNQLRHRVETIVIYSGNSPKPSFDMMRCNW